MAATTPSGGREDFAITIFNRLQAWRDAERSWESVDREDPGACRAAALAVVDAWLTYHEEAATYPRDLLLVVDGDGRYVAAGAESLTLLGYLPEEIVGKTVADLTSERQEMSADLWQSFLESGVQQGRYRLRHRDSRSVEFDYSARVHFPVPGFHMSRLTALASD